MGQFLYWIAQLRASYRKKSLSARLQKLDKKIAGLEKRLQHHEKLVSSLDKIPLVLMQDSLESATALGALRSERTAVSWELSPQTNNEVSQL